MHKFKPFDPKPRQIDTRGRVAVPPEIMELLGTKKGDLVTFVTDGKRVELCKVDWSVKRPS